MNGSLKLSIVLALALGSAQALAVELGQAHVKSALGQPLLVDIPITQATLAELTSLSAQLAADEAFVKAGGERPNIPLQFNVVDDHGHKLIRVTSSRAVGDPYLDLLVEVKSSTGRQVREFAILLDLPANMAREAVHSAPIGRYGSASNASPALSPWAARRAAPAHTATAAVKRGQFISTGKGATLSHIAVEAALSGVDYNQMMLALKAANPDAFYRDNINALKAGVILRVPSREEALATAVASAAAAVRQQNANWHHGASPSVAVFSGGTRASASLAQVAHSHADRLVLVPPGSEDQAKPGAHGKIDVQAVRQQLKRSQETLASLERQSHELASRLDELEDLNRKHQRLLALKDNEIADLRKELAQAREAAGQTAASMSTADTVSSGAKPAAPALAAASAARGAATSQTAPDRRKPAASEGPPRYLERWAWGAGAVVIAASLALVLLSRRGKSHAGSPKAAAASQGGPPAGDFDAPARLGQPAAGSDPQQDELLDQLAQRPEDLDLHQQLVRLYYTRRDVEHFEAAAEAMHAHTDSDQPQWRDVVLMGRELTPDHPLFAEPAAGAAMAREPPHSFELDSYDAASPSEPAIQARSATLQRAKVSEYHFDFDLTPRDPEQLALGADADGAAYAANTQYDRNNARQDDPVDTKLDLACVYLDMGDSDGARAMLEEVMHEGSPMQKDMAKQLLAKVN